MTMKKTYISPIVEIEEMDGVDSLLSTSPIDTKENVMGDYDDGVIQLSKNHSFDAFGMDDEE